LKEKCLKITLKQSDWQSYSRENFDVFGGIVIPEGSDAAIMKICNFNVIIFNS
jgi:hypothetical protein